MVSQATVCPGQPCLAELQAPGFQDTPGSDEPPCSALEPISQSPLSPCPNFPFRLSLHILRLSLHILHLLSGPTPSSGFRSPSASP